MLRKIENVGVWSEDLRGFFFIVKGQFTPSKGISSYDPESEGCREHYMLMDCVVFNTIACGPSLEKIKKSLVCAVRKYGSRREYFRRLHEYTTEDYYRVNYEGKPPYTEKDINDLTGKGRRCRVSPKMKNMFSEVYREYGDYFNDIIEECEDEGYSSARFLSPYEKGKKSKGKLKKVRKPLVEDRVKPKPVKKSMGFVAKPVKKAHR